MVGPVLSSSSTVKSLVKPSLAVAPTRQPVLPQHQHHPNQLASRDSHVARAQLGRQGPNGGARDPAAVRLGSPGATPTSDTRLNAAAADAAWGSDAALTADPSTALRRSLTRFVNLAVLGGAGAVVASKLLGAESGVWEMYQQAVATSPIEAKVRRLAAPPVPPLISRPQTRGDSLLVPHSQGRTACAAGVHLWHGV